MLSITGQFNDGQTSRTRDAVLVLHDDLSIHIESLQTSDVLVPGFPGSQASVHSRLGSTPRIIDLPDSARFVSEDHDGIDELRALVTPATRFNIIHILERNFALVLLSATITIGVFYLAIVEGIPELARVIATNLPADIQETIGTGTLELLDETVFDPSELDEDTRSRLLDRFEESIGTENRVRILFRAAPGIGANALALPPASVVFTDDLVRLAEHDDELTAVLFHELGHLDRHHITRRSLQASMITLLLIFITGDLSGINELIVGIPGLLVDASYSREFEAEADEFAIAHMQRAGIELDLFAAILTRLDTAREHTATSDRSTAFVESFLSSHPLTAERLQAIHDAR